MDNIINVLMTGAGAPGAPGIIKCLQSDPRIKLFVCDSDKNAIGKFLNQSFFVVPKATDEDFIDKMFEFCTEKNINVIFPLVTKELFAFAEYKEKFHTNGISIIVSESSSLNIANDKSKLYRYLHKHSIEVPNFIVANNLSEFKLALNKLGYPNNPVCFKPSVSNGSRGFRILDPSIDQYEMLFSLKPNNTYTTLGNIESILENKIFVELLVSEYLPGEEITVDCIANEGECLIVIPRRRIKMIEGISVKGEFINHTEVINYCKEIIKSLKLSGPIGIQVKQSKDGKFKLLEINPRIQGTSCSAMGLGINLPVISVYQAFGITTSIDCSKIKWGLKFSRYWKEVFHD